jgi:gliding motility-associated-like protein
MSFRLSGLLLGAVLMFSGAGTADAQLSQFVIVLNEYSAANVTGPTDDYGQHSDWVEIRNAHTSSVSISGYYLSNDRFNLFKWKIPAGFTMQSEELRLIWLSGRNTSANGQYHANFTLDQCKGQWLILSTPTGVIRDSVFVQKTKGDHSRGRIDISILGIHGWKLYAAHSALQTNPTINHFSDYCPTPQIFLSSENNTSYTTAINKGGFFPGPQIVYFRMNSVTYDTLVFPCFNVYYTVSSTGLSADYPIEVTPLVDPYRRYYDSTSSPFALDQTSVVRAVAVLNTTRTGCPTDYMPSFCETNTYFIDEPHQNFDPNFGVVSLSFDRADTMYFSTLGNPPSPTKPTTIHVEYYDQKQQVSEGYGIAVKPTHEQWFTKQKGFYISIDDRRGMGCNYEGNIFNVDVLGKSDRKVFETLHLYAGDMESHSQSIFKPEPISKGTGLRDVIMQSIAAKNNLPVNPLHIKPVIVFMNGKYWGVFNWKEVYDKYYEAYYNGQFRDSLDLNYVHGVESSVTYHDGTTSKISETWRSDVYDIATTKPMNSKVWYDKVMSKLYKESLIDYTILNTYAMNGDLWKYNVAFAKGTVPTNYGNKWHYYLWNMPTTFNYTYVLVAPSTWTNPNVSPCAFFSGPAEPIDGQSRAYAGHGNVLRELMTTPDNTKQACGQFQLQFKNRYMDLLNGPLKCENFLKHFDDIFNLYAKEMRAHEAPGNNGGFFTTETSWDTNMTVLRKNIEARCFLNFAWFKNQGCFGMPGPFPITVDVKPEGAGFVRLNTRILDTYRWEGNYYATTLSFKAIPSSSVYAFHHWEFKNHVPKEPLSSDSVSLASFTAPGDDVVAVFTDKRNDISADGENANLPTGFTPNGDGLNDVFKPLGPGEYVSDYQMTIWNRWGQEVFRSVDPTVGWDGTYKGQQALTGVYALILTYRNVFGQEKLVKGNVTLTR